jgi:hypothetical protein
VFEIQIIDCFATKKKFNVFSRMAIRMENHGQQTISTSPRYFDFTLTIIPKNSEIPLQKKFSGRKASSPQRFGAKTSRCKKKCQEICCIKLINRFIPAYKRQLHFSARFCSELARREGKSKSMLAFE